MSQGPHQSRADVGAPSSGDADSSRDDALIGRTLSGKYQIEKLLGGGAMGAVYRARFAALEKNVAVKVMHRAIAVDPNFVGRFHREAKAASRLDHPNSMRVIDFGEEPDGLLYITMEYVDGRDLYRVIHDDWPISNADLADILMQALAAIAVAHEMGVIHRDLKPENLMILRAKNDEGRDAYQVKVCDFGIAKITESDEETREGHGPAGRKLTTQGLVVGTPEYMSPEQARGEKLDPRSDIYSMGIILYQLLTGRTPFTGDTPLSVVLKHITEIPTAPSAHYAGVHRGLEAVAMRALEKDRADRWQTARDMRNAIREALEGRPAPLDAAAATITDTSAAPGTGPAMTPLGMPGASGPMIVAQSGTGPGPIESAPTVADGMQASRVTPLGTAAASLASKKSRTGLVLGLLVGAGIVVAGVVEVPKYLPRATIKTDSAITPVPSGNTTTTTTTASSNPSTPPSPSVVNAKNATPPTAPTDAKSAKHNALAPTGHAGSAKVPVAADPSPVPVEPAVPAPAAPDPSAAAATSAPVATSPSVPVTPAVPTPPPAPAFNAATCHATVGGAHSTGATNSKDLAMNGTAGAWTSCAQSSLHEKPAAPIAASVHLNFTDSGSFRGASCASCPPALAACVASSTGRTVSLKIRGGDLTGEPGFDVPVSFACD